MDIRITINGEREVVAKLQDFELLTHDRLLTRATALAEELASKVRAAEPSDTGKLRSETRSRVFDDKTRIKAQVYVGGDFSEKTKRGSVWAGQVAALEYGAHAAAVVRAHETTLGHVYSRLISPMKVFVAAYRRQLNLEDQAFLRGSLEEMAPEIDAALKAAVEQAVGEVQA